MLLRNLILAFLPATTRERIEAESRQWMMRCTEGHEQSVWDAGGIRYGAAGQPTRVVWCPQCQRPRQHVLYHDGKPSGADFTKGTSPNKGRSVMRIICIIFCVIGPIFLLAGFLSSAPWRFTATGLVATTGRVEQIDRSGPKRGAIPVVSYEVDGRPYTVKGRVATSPAAYRIGEEVKVLYQPADPSQAVIDSFVERWLLPAIFGAIGGVFSLFGIGGLVLIRLRGPRQRTDGTARGFPE